MSEIIYFIQIFCMFVDKSATFLFFRATAPAARTVCCALSAAKAVLSCRNYPSISPVFSSILQGKLCKSGCLRAAVCLFVRYSRRGCCHRCSAKQLHIPVMEEILLFAVFAHSPGGFAGCSPRCGQPLSLTAGRSFALRGQLPPGSKNTRSRLSGTVSRPGKVLRVFLR